MPRSPTRHRPTLVERWSRTALAARLKLLHSASLLLADPEQVIHFGSDSAEAAYRLDVCDFRLYPQALFGGSLGIAEAYIRGYWECDDLLELMRVMARNATTLSKFDRGWARLLKPIRRLGHWLARNTPAGSKRNICAHYDLSNEFFALFLDSTMTYSAGIFEQPESTLTDAMIAKYERLCQLLDLKSHDHLLEIGTGWGGLACFAAREYGCRVTTTTISKAQHEYARDQIESAGLWDRVTLLQQDYRELQGEFDKIVSVEMIEAVGHEYLGTFFTQCDKLLKPGGKIALQVITIPDQRYERYRNSVDFIQRYIFPGGCLPSLGALLGASSDRTNLQLISLDEFGEDYARTLARWRENFHQNIDQIRDLGIPERLIRTWHYYFCYCEAAFHEKMIGLKQMVFAKTSV